MQKVSNSQPLVSVILPSYNHARFLPQRLDSILAQTFCDFELIVLDDCSTDNSRSIIEEYARRFPMKAVFNELNSGSPFIQWKRGAEMATGKYLWIAESDDYADPRLLETLVTKMTLNPTVGLAYCQSVSVDADNQVAGTWEHWTQELDAKRWNQDFVNCGRDEVANYLVRRNTIPNASAVLLKRDILLESLPKMSTMRLSGDWWTWCNILLRSDVAFVAEPLNHFRTHGLTVRGTIRLPASCEERFEVLAHVCSLVEITPAVRRKIFHEAFNKWRQCFDSSDFRPTVDWLRGVGMNATRVSRSAGIRMAWFLVKHRLNRIRPVIQAVRSRLSR